MDYTGTSAPESVTRMPFLLELGLSDEEIKARFDMQRSDNFLHTIHKRVPAAPIFTKKGRIKPAEGLGHSVIVGFDSEHTAGKNGRNRQISVQFYLLGATGESIAQVIHLTDNEHIDERPSLKQCIADLIELAMDEGVLEDWPSEVILAGLFTRADLPGFSDFKHFLKEVDGVHSILAS